MREQHKVDSYDQRSFFTLHDTNVDGFLQPSELAHFYRIYVGDQNEDAFKQWTKEVLSIVDLNKDGKVSFEEYRRPAFEDRVFSQEGKGGKASPGVVGTSSWSTPRVSMKDGVKTYEYHNVPLKYRLHKG